MKELRFSKKDYSAEQLAVWAPKNLDLEKWQSSLMKNDCLVAVIDNWFWRYE
ncbi:hypothetical protein [Enterococcus cecorum]|uniref:hypothetical protein n=1 Tax=Enterococcus cecorum TaxID=44008 RepID=UPI0032C41D9A